MFLIVIIGNCCQRGNICINYAQVSIELLNILFCLFAIVRQTQTLILKDWSSALQSTAMDRSPFNLTAFVHPVELDAHDTLFNSIVDLFKDRNQIRERHPN